MQPYKHSENKESGVVAFKIQENSILVQFRKGDTYLYTYSSAGSAAIEQMKTLAEAGKGLSTYISKNNPPYQEKINPI